MCNYLYMYWDGPGGSNIDCKSRSSPGCWGHRKNIIRKWGSKVSAKAFRLVSLFV